MGRMVEMVMPSMGESVMEATILQWLKQEGEPITEDESVLEVATDKVDTEVPATQNGILNKILVKEGDVIEIGKPLAMVELVSKEETKVYQQKEQLVTVDAEVSHETHQTKSNGKTPLPTFGNSERFYSPLVRSIAQEENITEVELAQIEGRGKEGRVTKEDILQYLKIRYQPTTVEKERKSVLTPTFQEANLGKSISSPNLNGQDEIIEMDRMRKMIAHRMVESKQISAHVASFVEADLTTVVQWRNEHKISFKKKHGYSLTFMPIFLEAIVKSIRDFPLINISVDGDKIIQKKHINIGMAVALPSGNLIVPVIHNADHYNLSGLAKKVNDLAERARLNQLKPDEVQGGTYTVSNIGTFGNILGTPIILQPQVAIMAFGAITKKPAVIETPEGDLIGIRHKMFLSHSYDHRVVDGALGGMFVKRVANYLENFDTSQVV